MAEGAFKLEGMLTDEQLQRTQEVIAKAMTKVQRVQQKIAAKTENLDVFGKDEGEMIVAGIDKASEGVVMGEWSIALAQTCSATLVAQGAAEILQLPKSIYFRYVKQHRIDAVRLNAALRTVSSRTVELRSARDSLLLLQTLLTGTHILKTLPANLQALIARRCTYQFLSRGDMLFHEGDPVDGTYFVLNGELSLHQHTHEHAKVQQHERSRAKSIMPHGHRPGEALSHKMKYDGVYVRDAVPGASVGEWGMISDQEWLMTARANGDCDLIHIPRHVFEEAIEDVIDVAIEGVSAEVPLQALEQATEILKTTGKEQRNANHVKVLEHVLKHYKLFSHADSKVRSELCQCIYYQKVKEGDVICNFGEEINVMCIVVSGELGIFLPETTFEDNLMSECSKPDYEVCVSFLPRFCSFGEEALMASPEIVQTSCKATLDSELLCLDRKSFSRVMVRCRQGLADRENAIVTLKCVPSEDRTEEHLKSLMKLLRHNEFLMQFFSNVDKSTILEACKMMQWSCHDQDSTVCRQGDESDNFYFLLRGSVGVWVNEDLKEIQEQREQERNQAGKTALSKFRRSSMLGSVRNLTKKLTGGLKSQSPGTIAKQGTSGSLEDGGTESATFVTQEDKEETAKTASRRNSSSEEQPEKREANAKGRPSVWKRLSVEGTSATKSGNQEGTVTQVNRDFGRQLTAGKGSARWKMQMAQIDIEDFFKLDPETGGPWGSKLVIVLHEGKSFGEQGLMYDEKRNATIVCREFCEFAIIDKQAFNTTLKSMFKKSAQKKIDFLKSNLPVHPGDQRITYEFIEGFFREKSVVRSMGPLCVSGKKRAALALIYEGSCKIVARNKKGTRIELGELFPGHFLGVSSLILNEAEHFDVFPSTAEVKLLRMEATDVHSRLPSTLLKTIGELERVRIENLHARVAFDRSLQNECLRNEYNTELRSQMEGFKSLEDSPFLKHKRDHIRAGQHDLLQKLHTNWSPPEFADTLHRFERDPISEQITSAEPPKGLDLDALMAPHPDDIVALALPGPEQLAIGRFPGLREQKNPSRPPSPPRARSPMSSRQHDVLGSALRSNHQVSASKIGFGSREVPESNTDVPVQVTLPERPKSAPQRTTKNVDVTALTPQGKRNNAVMSAASASLTRSEEGNSKLWVPMGVRVARLHERRQSETEKDLKKENSTDKNAPKERSASPQTHPNVTKETPSGKGKGSGMAVESSAVPVAQPPDTLTDAEGESKESDPGYGGILEEPTDEGQSVSSKELFPPIVPPIGPQVGRLGHPPTPENVAQSVSAGTSNLIEFIPPTGPQIGNPGRPPSPENSQLNASMASVSDVTSPLVEERPWNSSKHSSKLDSRHGTVPEKQPEPPQVKEDEVEDEETDNSLNAPEAPGAIVPMDTGKGVCAMSLPGSLHSNRLPLQVMRGQLSAQKTIKRPGSAQSTTRAQRPQSAQRPLSASRAGAPPVKGIRARSAVMHLAGPAAARTMRRTAAGHGNDILQDPMAPSNKGPPASRSELEEIKLQAGRRVQFQNKYVNLIL